MVRGSPGGSGPEGPPTRKLYRVVSQTEFDRIQETGRFELGGGAEGKYFWERLSDAKSYCENYKNPRIVVATYAADAVKTFHRWSELDRHGNAYFADEGQMNKSLVSIDEGR